MKTCHYINSGKSNIKFEYIGEFETELKKFLEYESGAQVGSIEKSRGRKSRATVPLNLLYYRLKVNLHEILDFCFFS